MSPAGRAAAGTAAGLAADRAHRLWLGLTLAMAALAAGLGTADAFAPTWLAQDDARQHVFWMARLADPAAFPSDPIADYFQSVAPAGYVGVYRTGLAVGLSPAITSRLLPPLLTLVCAWLVFRVARGLGASPVGAFVAGWLLVAILWLMDDVPSGTPRAFAVPVLLWFFDAWLGRHAVAGRVSAVAAVVASGLLYPQMVLVMVGVAALGLVRARRPWLSRDPADWRTALPVGLAAALVLLPYVLAPSAYGPVISAAAARQAPAFQPDGRSAFFDPDPVRFITCGGRAGLMPKEWCFAADRFADAPWYGALAAGFLALVLLPWLLDRLRPGRAGQASGSARDQRGAGPDARALIPRIAGASLLLFGTAHAVLFLLHLPSRYTHYSLRILFVLAVGLLVGGLLHRVAGWLAIGRPVRTAGAMLLLPAAAAALVAARSVADNGYITAAADDPLRPVLAAIAALPPDARLATLSPAGSVLPVVTGRSVLAAHEFMIPYHRGYFEPLQARAARFVAARRLDGLPAVQAALRRLGVSHVLVDARVAADSRSDAAADLRWVADLPGDAGASGLAPGSGMQALIATCRLLASGPYILVAVQCRARRERG